MSTVFKAEYGKRQCGDPTCPDPISVGEDVSFSGGLLFHAECNPDSFWGDSAEYLDFVEEYDRTY